MQITIIVIMIRQHKLDYKYLYQLFVQQRLFLTYRLRHHIMGVRPGTVNIISV